MKKYLILFLVAGLFTFTACSDDDDTETDDGSRIVGVWTFASVSPPNELFNPDACQTPSTIDLQSDGTVEGTFYLASEGCAASEVTDGSWEYLGDSEYAIEFPGLGVQQGIANFNGEDAFTFSTTLNFEGFEIPVVLGFTK